MVREKVAMTVGTNLKTNIGGKRMTDVAFGRAAEVTGMVDYAAELVFTVVSAVNEHFFCSLKTTSGYLR